MLCALLFAREKECVSSWCGNVRKFETKLNCIFNSLVSNPLLLFLRASRVTSEWLLRLTSMALLLTNLCLKNIGKMPQHLF